MDNLWENAWGEPEKPPALPVKSSTTQTSWRSHDDVTKVQEEADVGLPSWATGSVGWAEPSGQVSLWTAAVDEAPLGGWETTVDNPSTSLKLPPLASVKHIEHDETVEDDDYDGDHETIQEDDAPPTSNTSLRSRINEPLPLSPAPPLSPAHIHLPQTPLPVLTEAPFSERSESPDPFGSFESGIDDASSDVSDLQDPWTPAAPVFDSVETDANGWGTAWDHTSGSIGGDDSTCDEWEVAKERKLKQHRKVPPEVLAAILDSWSEISEKIWPKHSESDKSDEQSGIQNLKGLPPIDGKFMPDTIIRPPINYAKSHTAKAMANSIKLSKHLPIAKSSPMSYLFAAKGSSAWELAVKNRVEVLKDDLPAGWRTIEPEAILETKPSAPEKKVGVGLLSFWGRRSSTVSPTTSSKDVSEVSKLAGVNGPAPARASAEVRPSTDNAKAASQTTATAVNKDVTPPNEPKRTSVPSSPVVPFAEQGTSTPLQAQEAVSVAPSVVSRFLGRFSRTKSDGHSRSLSPRSSVVLSSDDLDALSDMVPGHSDGMDEDAQLKGLTNMLATPALPTKLPSPLAPPPPPPRRTQQHIPTPLLPSKPQSNTITSPLDDLASLDSFLSPSNQGFASTSRMAPILPHPSSTPSFSKPPTPSPLHGLPAFDIHGPAANNSRSSSPRSPPLRAASPLPFLPTASQSRTQIPSPLPLAQYQNPQVAGSLTNDQFSITQPKPPGYSRPANGSPGLPVELSPPPRNAMGAALINNLFDDDDEFSDFHSYPSQSNFVPSGSALDSSFDTTSGSLLPNSQNAQSSFGDFGDFISTPLRTPSPPRPPAKFSSPKVSTGTSRRSSREVEHQLTINLMEKAAARGQWPAPPSPLPQPIAPPPLPRTHGASGASNGGFFDAIEERSPPLVFDTPSRPASQSSRPKFPPVVLKSVSSPPQSPLSSNDMASLRPFSLPPPPGHSSFGTAHPRSGPVAGSPPLVMAPFPEGPATINSFSKSVPTQKGGLSAQDLSFFEGL